MTDTLDFTQFNILNIQDILGLRKQMTNNCLQESVLSRKKHIVFKIIDQISESALVYKEVITKSHIERDFFEEVLLERMEGLNWSLLKQQQENHHLQYKIKTIEQLLVLQIITKMQNSLSIHKHYLQSSLNAEEDNIIDISIMKLQLISIFVSNQKDIEQLILTNDNIKIQATSESLVINFGALTGLDLLIFEKTISRDEFMEIYCFLDSEILYRDPPKRINYKQRIRNFSVLLLQCILQKEVVLLKNHQLPQIIDLETAKNELKISSKRFDKYLKLKAHRNQIDEFSNKYKIDLMIFLQHTLVDELYLSWPEIIQLFCSPHLQKSTEYLKFQYQCLKASGYLWNSMNTQHRMHFIDKRFVSLTNISSLPTTLDSQLLLIIEFDLDINVVLREKNLVLYLMSDMENPEEIQLFRKFIGAFVQYEHQELILDSLEELKPNQQASQMREKRQKGNFQPQCRFLFDKKQLIPDQIPSLNYCDCFQTDKRKNKQQFKSIRQTGDEYIETIDFLQKIGKHKLQVRSKQSSNATSLETNVLKTIRAYRGLLT